MPCRLNISCHLNVDETKGANLVLGIKSFRIKSLKFSHIIRLPHAILFLLLQVFGPLFTSFIHTAGQ
jgi:hypothetical protein